MCVEVRPAWINPQRQHAIGVESQFHVENADEATHEQAVDRRLSGCVEAASIAITRLLSPSIEGEPAQTEPNRENCPTGSS